MHISGVPECVSVEAEIAAAREDSSGGFKGVLGELAQSLACLSDPLLRESLSPPYNFALEDLLSPDRACQFYMMAPPEMIEDWAPVIKSFFTSAKTLKARASSAPRQTWFIDEAGRLKDFNEIPALFTDGAGIGIRPVAVFQDASQMNDLARDGERKMSSSAAVQVYFGVRDRSLPKRVSDMVGSETLTFDDPLQQGRAAVQLRQGIAGVFGGSDLFETVLGLRRTATRARI